VIVYPAIDLRGGRVVRLLEGDFDRETEYGTDPVAQALEFVADGARWVHVVDLDAARGEGHNREVIERIAAESGVDVQVGGGVRDAALLEINVSRVVIGSLFTAEPSAAARLMERHPGRVVVGLDHREGRLRVAGWESDSGVDLLDALGWVETAAAAAVVVTDIATDGALTGPSLGWLEKVVAASPTEVIASGGVADLEDLVRIREVGAAGVIIGRAIYEGRFSLREAIEAAR
jgi:phosphoribosylformimino-5-aminoimidazole carboxamide ribotide isomerase